MRAFARKERNRGGAKAARAAGYDDRFSRQRILRALKAELAISLRSRLIPVRRGHKSPYLAGFPSKTRAPADTARIEYGRKDKTPKPPDRKRCRACLRVLPRISAPGRVTSIRRL